MGITRRQFLRWTGVSALGAVIFNGCRIPEEELQVESPVNLPEDLVTGIDNWYATACRQDPGGCGVIIRVVEGRAKKVEGNPDFPINRGKHSARSEAGLQALYHPDRLETPMFRANRSDDFLPISWERAREILNAGMNNLSDRSRFLLVTEPLRGHLALLASEFVKAYGGRHMAFQSLEQVNLHRAVKEVFGQDRLPDFDIENANYLFSFGADFLSTWLSPVRYARGYGEFRQGDRKRGVHYQIDTRFSMTTANADKWVPVKPGGEGVLAMSMAYVIIRDGMGNTDAAAALTDGQGHEALNAFAPDSSMVRDVTGMESAAIEDLAHTFADEGHQPSLAIGGGSAGAHKSGLFNLKAIYALNILVDNVGKNGGVIFNPPPPLPELSSNEVASMGMPASFQQWSDLAGSGSVDVLMVRGANPVHGLPPGANFSNVVNGAGFVIAFSSFMDETASMANLVLPEHVYLEDWGDNDPDPGPQYQTLGIQQPVVRPFLPGTSGFGDELLVLGRELDLGLEGKLSLAPDATMQDLLKAGAEKLWSANRGSVTASSFEGFWNGVLQRGGWWDTQSRNDSGVAEIKPLDTAWDGSGLGDPGAGSFSLVPFLSHSLGDGQLANLPWLQATPDPITTVVWHTWVEINSKVAEEMGIIEGDILAVESGAGMVEAPAFPHPGVPPKTVSIPIGQGHTALGQYAEEVGANTLSLIEPITDKDTQALAWAATKVRVSKTGQRIDIPKFAGNQFAEEPHKGVIIKVTGPS